MRLFPLLTLTLSLLLSACAKPTSTWVAESKSPDPYVRRLAVNALGNRDVFLQDPEAAIEAILARTIDWNHTIKVEAHLSYIEVRDLAAEPLVNILCTENTEWAARELAKLGSVALPILGETLRDKSCEHRDLVMRLIASRRAEGAPLLLAALDDPDPSTQELALAGIELLPNPKAYMPELRARHSNAANDTGLRGRIERTMRKLADL